MVFSRDSLIYINLGSGPFYKRECLKFILRLNVSHSFK